MPGPKPKPTALKVLQGNPGHQKLPKNEPRPRPISPEIPPYLDETGRKRWQELAPELESTGVLTVIDGDILASYCAAYSRVYAATEYLKEHGNTYQVGTNGAFAARPEVGILNRALDDLRRFGAELGIGAASRSRIEVNKKDDGPSAIERIWAENTRKRG